jgi:hypothetical protein
MEEIAMEASEVLESLDELMDARLAMTIAIG